MALLNAGLKPCATFCILLAASAAFAQSPAQPVNQGPMVVERMHSGFVFAPDVKVTEVDRTTSALAGGYAGWLTDETFFIGGGGYWLANQARDRRMAYGGLVVQWLANRDRRVGFGVRGLLGGGEATLRPTITDDLRLADVRTMRLPTVSRRDIGRDVTRTLQAPTTLLVPRFSQGFFVAEPQVDVLVRLSKSLRLTGGIGYRLVAAEGREDGRLRGATGSIALQVGGGS